MTVSSIETGNIVGVVGAGTMGVGLAEMAVRSGYHVLLKSRTMDSGSAARHRMTCRLDRDVAKGTITTAGRDDMLERFTTTDTLADLEPCNLVMESVVEDIDVKRSLFADLDRIARPDAILASNTSTLPIIEMAMATRRPDRVCGLHFFNPVVTMPLVEVARPLTADEATVATAVQFAESCGKRPIVVDDTPGFIVNALLFPYLNSAVKLYERGVASKEAIDDAMRGGCNFPIGPLALLDLVGLDTSVAILDALHDEFKEPGYAAATTLRRMVSAGMLGRKSGCGFFTY